jgi:hypothetical protein
VTTDAKGARRNTAATSEWKSNPGDTLLDAVRTEASAWPTPCARDRKGPFRKSTKAGTNLPHMVEMEASARPTPTANRYGSTNNGDPGDGRTAYATAGTPSLDTIATREGGKLNPDWVSTIMGAPPDWTRLSSEVRPITTVAEARWITPKKRPSKKRDVPAT